MKFLDRGGESRRPFRSCLTLSACSLSIIIGLGACGDGGPSTAPDFATVIPPKPTQRGSGGAGDPCQDWSDCSVLRCEWGVCAPSSCDVDRDCGDASLRCVLGKCYPSTEPKCDPAEEPPRCGSNEWCNPASTECEPAAGIGETCTQSAMCRAGECNPVTDLCEERGAPGEPCTPQSLCADDFCHPSLLTCGLGAPAQPCEADDWCKEGLLCEDAVCTEVLCEAGTRECKDSWSARVCVGRGARWQVSNCPAQLCHDGTCFDEVVASTCPDRFNNSGDLHTRLTFYEAIEDRTLLTVEGAAAGLDATYVFYESTDGVDYHQIAQVSPEEDGSASVNIPLRAGNNYAIALGPNNYTIHSGCSQGELNLGFLRVIGAASWWWTDAPGRPGGFAPWPTLTNVPPELSSPSYAYFFGLTVAR